MRAPLAAAVLAFALTLGYAALVQPSWEPQHTDQLQYLSLARGLVERGQFTRAIAGEPFIPETYRLPGYALLLAPLCVGACDHWRIALMQALLVAALVLAAYALARRVAPARAPSVAFAVALFLPFAYYGAIALSDLPGAALFGLGMLAFIRATDRRSTTLAFAAGSLFGCASLMRGALVGAPLLFAAAAVIADRRLVRVASAAVLATAIVLAPYVAYSQMSFGRVTGGTSGLVLWLGVFQARAESSLDEVERAQASAARSEIAVFDAMPDRRDRALAWLVLDDSLGARARQLIAHDPIGWIAGALPRSLELWAGERPVPGGATGALAVALTFVQLLLFGGGIAGTILLLRRDDLAARLIGLGILYVWLTALPFQTEARYALPGKMPAIVAAFVLFDSWRSRSRRSAAGSAPDSGRRP